MLSNAAMRWIVNVTSLRFMVAKMQCTISLLGLHSKTPSFLIKDDPGLEASVPSPNASLNLHNSSFYNTSLLHLFRAHLAIQGAQFLQQLLLFQLPLLYAMLRTVRSHGHSTCRKLI
jgi:hypothetical protein